MNIENMTLKLFLNLKVSPVVTVYFLAYVTIILSGCNQGLDT